MKIKYNKKTIFFKDQPKNVSRKDWWEAFQKHLSKETNKSEALPIDICKGKLIRLYVDDSNECFYEITDVGKQTVTLKLRNDLCPDLCSDQVLQEGGVFTVCMIGRMVNSFV